MTGAYDQGLEFKDRALYLAQDVTDLKRWRLAAGSLAEFLRT